MSYAITKFDELTQVLGIYTKMLKRKSTSASRKL